MLLFSSYCLFHHITDPHYWMFKWACLLIVNMYWIVYKGHSGFCLVCFAAIKLIAANPFSIDHFLMVFILLCLKEKISSRLELEKKTSCFHCIFYKKMFELLLDFLCVCVFVCIFGKCFCKEICCKMGFIIQTWYDLSLLLLSPSGVRLPESHGIAEWSSGIPWDYLKLVSRQASHIFFIQSHPLYHIRGTNSMYH